MLYSRAALLMMKHLNADSEEYEIMRSNYAHLSPYAEHMGFEAYLQMEMEDGRMPGMNRQVAPVSGQRCVNEERSPVARAGTRDQEEEESDRDRGGLGSRPSGRRESRQQRSREGGRSVDEGSLRSRVGRSESAYRSQDAGRSDGDRSFLSCHGPGELANYNRAFVSRPRPRRPEDSLYHATSRLGSPGTRRKTECRRRTGCRDCDNALDGEYGYSDDEGSAVSISTSRDIAEYRTLRGYCGVDHSRETDPFALTCGTGSRYPYRSTENRSENHDYEDDYPTRSQRQPTNSSTHRDPISYPRPRGQSPPPPPRLDWNRARGDRSAFTRGSPAQSLSLTRSSQTRSDDGCASGTGYDAPPSDTRRRPRSDTGIPFRRMNYDRRGGSPPGTRRGGYARDR